MPPAGNATSASNTTSATKRGCGADSGSLILALGLFLLHCQHQAGDYLTSCANLQTRTAQIITDWFVASTQMIVKEAFRDGEKRGPIFRLAEIVRLVRVEQVGHRLFVLLQLRNEAVGLVLRHDLIFASLCNEYGFSKAFSVMKGRNLFEQGAALFGRVIADQFAPGSLGARTGLGDKRIQLRRGVHRQRRERCITAIRPAPNADALARRDPLLNGPIGGIYQIVLHPAAPLARPRFTYFSSQSARGAELNPQRRVAAIRQ